MTIETTLKWFSDKWWAYYFDEYSFTFFLILSLLVYLLGVSKSPIAEALNKWIVGCFPAVLKKWDGKVERRIKTNRKEIAVDRREIAINRKENAKLEKEKEDEIRIQDKS